MASSLPIPAPPRTPTPPSPVAGLQDSSLRIDCIPPHLRSTAAYNPDSLSPMRDFFPGVERFKLTNTMDSPASATSTLSVDSMVSIGTMGPPPPPSGPRNPFNFQTQTIKDTPAVVKSVGQPHFVLHNLDLHPSPLHEAVNLESPSRTKFPGLGLGLSHYEAYDEYAKFGYRPSPSNLSENGQCSPFALSPDGGQRSPSLGRCASGNSLVLDRRRHLLPNLTPPITELPSKFPAINREKQNIGQRRGHRYKHSSVSTQHQIFLEPPPRAPLALPASLPIPTFREAWSSMSRDQTIRICWCFCHFLVSAYVLSSAEGSLALTALSHLVFFDAISATICVVVDVFHNFEVWQRSSIRHPFGLERAEVLAGFAMSVFLLFMGFDLFSHNLKHVLESMGSHTPHHPHTHQRISPGSVDSAALLSIIATLISGLALRNHARIGRVMRFAYLSHLPSVLSNPSHFLTLSCSSVMLLLPLLTITIYLWLDRLLCTIIALSMFALGVRLAIAQGSMLLMSYSAKGVNEVMMDVTSDPAVASIEEARFWQVHYGLCMANLKLRLKGAIGGPNDDAALLKLRERICLLVKNRLGVGYGKGGGLAWEVTVQFTGEDK